MDSGEIYQDSVKKRFYKARKMLQDEKGVDRGAKKTRIIDDVDDRKERYTTQENRMNYCVYTLTKKNYSKLQFTILQNYGTIEL